MPKRSVILLLTGLLTVTTLAAQTPLREGTTEREAHQEAVRTEAQSDTAMTLTAADRSLELTKRELKQAEKGTFVPDPKKATYLALVPGVGLGQIYNRKYWKLPLVYAGYAGLIYALVYSNNNYRDYKRAYISIADQDETTNEYTKYIPAGKGRNHRGQSMVEQCAEPKIHAIPPIPGSLHHRTGCLVRPDRLRRLRGRAVVRLRHLPGPVASEHDVSHALLGVDRGRQSAIRPKRKIEKERKRNAFCRRRRTDPDACGEVFPKRKPETGKHNDHYEKHTNIRNAISSLADNHAPRSADSGKHEPKREREYHAAGRPGRTAGRREHRQRLDHYVPSCPAKGKQHTSHIGTDGWQYGIRDVGCPIGIQFSLGLAYLLLLCASLAPPSVS